jgi:tetratricopeptide (TPR) repeat protein
VLARSIHSLLLIGFILGAVLFPTRTWAFCVSSGFAEICASDPSRGSSDTDTSDREARAEAWALQRAEAAAERDAYNRLTDNFFAATQRGDYNMAITLADQIAQFQPGAKNRAMQQWARGRQRESVGDYNGALLHYRQAQSQINLMNRVFDRDFVTFIARAIDRTTSELQWQRGSDAFAKGDWSAAKSAWQEALHYNRDQDARRKLEGNISLADDRLAYTETAVRANSELAHATTNTEQIVTATYAAASSTFANDPKLQAAREQINHASADSPLSVAQQPARAQLIAHSVSSETLMLLNNATLSGNDAMNATSLESAADRAQCQFDGNAPGCAHGTASVTNPHIMTPVPSSDKLNAFYQTLDSKLQKDPRIVSGIAMVNFDRKVAKEADQTLATANACISAKCPGWQKQQTFLPTFEVAARIATADVKAAEGQLRGTLLDLSVAPPPGLFDQ